MRPFPLTHYSDVELVNPPLERTLAQFRWDPITALQPDGGFDEVRRSFGRAIAGQYPRAGAAAGGLDVMLTPDGLRVTQVPTALWLDAAQMHAVALTPTSVSLDLRTYESRAQLGQRLDHLWRQLTGIIDIPILSRIGVRYINRFPASSIADLFRPGTYPDRALHEWVEQSVQETLLGWGDDRHLLVRWAKLPAGTTIDPAIVQLGEASVVLDLDAYKSNVGPLPTPTMAAGLIEELSRAAYDGFRDSVSDLVVRGEW